MKSYLRSPRGDNRNVARGQVLKTQETNFTSVLQNYKLSWINLSTDAFF